MGPDGGPCGGRAGVDNIGAHAQVLAVSGGLKRAEAGVGRPQQTGVNSRVHFSSRTATACFPRHVYDLTPTKSDLVVNCHRNRTIPIENRHSNFRQCDSPGL